MKIRAIEIERDDGTVIRLTLEEFKCLREMRIADPCLPIVIRDPYWIRPYWVDVPYITCSPSTADLGSSGHQI